MIHFKSEILFHDEVSTAGFAALGLDVSHSLLIYDKNIEALISQDFLNSFLFKYPVAGGEELKDFSHYPRHLKNILELWNTSVSRESVIFALGGGSIGDFSGFTASILKRGVRIVHCPSTWLSAIDSAHGGKTALNVSSFKNQIGTFYPADKVFLFKELLMNQPLIRATEGLGELVKIALIDGFFHQLDFSKTANELLWTHLEKAINGKYKVVLQDPYETQGLRKILNLGHTFGHVLEVQVPLSHGDAVTQGLFFTLAWSRERGVLDELSHRKIIAGLEQLGLRPLFTRNDYKKINSDITQASLMKDKKMNSDGNVDFVFIKSDGKVFPEKVAVNSIVAEAVRQGWCLS